MCQEIEQLIEPLTAEAVETLERALGDDGLTAMQASAFERLRHELILEVVPCPLDGHAAVAGDAGQAYCLRARNAEHLKQFSLIKVVNKVSGEMVEVHVPCGQNDVCGAETKQGNHYKQALRQSHLMNLDYDREQALRMHAFEAGAADSTAVGHACLAHVRKTDI